MIDDTESIEPVDMTVKVKSTTVDPLFFVEPDWRYNEDAILDELRTYLASTYGAHYVGEDDIQAIDLIASGGMLMQFAASSVIKYAFRFGKKDGLNRKDLLKIIHYAMFMLWQMDRKKK